MKVMMMMMMMVMMKKMIQDESVFSALGAHEWTTDLQIIIACNHFGICVYHKPMTTTCVGCKLRQPGAYAIPTPSVWTGQPARPTGFATAVGAFECTASLGGLVFSSAELASVE